MAQKVRNFIGNFFASNVVVFNYAQKYTLMSDEQVRSQVNATFGSNLQAKKFHHCTKKKKMIGQHNNGLK